MAKHLPEAHILACAPSNSGADLLCQRLRAHLPSSVYRLLAPSRDICMVPEDIKVSKEVGIEGLRDGRREVALMGGGAGSSQGRHWDGKPWIPSLLCELRWIRTPL